MGYGANSGVHAATRLKRWNRKWWTRLWRGVYQLRQENMHFSPPPPRPAPPDALKGLNGLSKEDDLTASSAAVAVMTRDGDIGGAAVAERLASCGRAPVD